MRYGVDGDETDSYAGTAPQGPGQSRPVAPRQPASRHSERLVPSWQSVSSARTDVAPPLLPLQSIFAGMASAAAYPSQPYAPQPYAPQPYAQPAYAPAYAPQHEPEYQPPRPSGRILGIEEPLAERDEQLGRTFFDIRLALRLTVPGLARRLNVKPDLIDAFEAGAVAGLPEWSETVRIVEGYAALATIDPSPLLSRLLIHDARFQAKAAASSAATWPHQGNTHPLDNGISAASPQRLAPHDQVTAAPFAYASPTALAYVPAQVGHNYPLLTEPSAPPIARAPETALRPKRAAAVRNENPAPIASRPRLSAKVVRGIAAATIVVTIAAAFMLAPTITVATYRATGYLPDSVASPIRAALNPVLVMVSPTDEGLTWVDVGDPQLRKTARLKPRS